MAATHAKSRFGKLLSPRGQALFFAAIFMTFASIGLLVSRGVAVDGLARTFSWTVFSGLAAVGWAWSFTRDSRLLFVVIPVSFVVPRLIGRGQLTYDEVGVFALVVAGYVLFALCITLEGTRSLRFQTEIGLARELHSRLVPTIERTTAILEVYGTSSPCDEVGGDLLDIVDLDSAVDLHLADVSGHGVAAGALMGMTKSALRMGARDRRALGDLIADPDAVVAGVRKQPMFVTFAALRVDANGSAEYGLAGHLPIVHCRPSTGVVDHLGEPSPPLGTRLRPQKTAHPTGRVQAEPGDLFVLLTDGLTEARDGGGRELGGGPIEETIRRHHAEPLSSLHDRILRLVEGHGPQDDDRTLLLARVRKRPS